MLREWLERAHTRLSTTNSMVRGIPVIVINTRDDVETEDVLRSLDEALGLIERHTPHYWRHLRRDFAGIEVRRYACRGAYFFDTQHCLVELTFTVNPAFNPAQIAATILHEAMHARLDRLGFPREMADRARQERFCRRAEVELGCLAPGGDPVVARALAALAEADDDVAPLVDEELATRRVAEADLRASHAPLWVRQAIARRHGFTLE